MTKGIDLAELDTQVACDKGYELELRHPGTNVPIGVFITVLGRDSTAFRDHSRKRGNHRLAKQFQNQRRGKDAEVPTFEMAEKEAIDLLVAVTTGWRSEDEDPDKTGPFIFYDKKKLDFNEANVRFLYTKFSAFRDQVDEAVGDLSNFIGS